MGRPDVWHLGPEDDIEFPEVEVGRGVTFQWVKVTPEMARDWLVNRNKSQRPIKQLHLQSLKDDHVLDRFFLNGETVVFDWDGNLLNGQHRATMVVETDKPAWMIVLRNLPPDVYTTFDNTAKRSGGDALRPSGITNANHVAAAANLLERYRRGVLGKSNIKLSPIAVEQIVRENPGLVEAATVAQAYRSFGSPSAFAFSYFILSAVNSEKATEFFSSLYDGAGLEKGHPILALRQRAFRAIDLDAVDVVFLLFKAWNDWRRNRTVFRYEKRSKDTVLPSPI